MENTLEYLTADNFEAVRKIQRDDISKSWIDYATAMEKLKYDSNIVALWELDNKLRMGLL